MTSESEINTKTLDVPVILNKELDFLRKMTSVYKPGTEL